MDKIYFLHDALIISQISVWEMVLFSQLLYLMFCNGPNQFSYFLICNIVEARISWKSGFFFCQFLCLVTFVLLIILRIVSYARNS